ncbi:hypothetical protein ABEB36_008370 [Hypothenemus hampei]|uniref:Uncharacterized protein n=1 Tax=Hypothenemus hampei TaxID=57062 RepID=A0ABD1EQP4_HYPHA
MSVNEDLSSEDDTEDKVYEKYQSTLAYIMYRIESLIVDKSFESNSSPFKLSNATTNASGGLVYKIAITLFIRININIIVIRHQLSLLLTIELLFPIIDEPFVRSFDSTVSHLPIDNFGIDRVEGRRTAAGLLVRVPCTSSYVRVRVVDSPSRILRSK